ncbi:hypothetical protein AYL99_11193 [Fonsecaea erecta]|uniref:non-specific serine/threonine protein kinase n=1 Tax=Fonsecaea erecta TaxID=1367422 RepID=A0A178Z6R1_9EURO|nr:hypothetical protein AYL99_11193 [Fonsecaea erecta]OAP54745.1 hypothetical protein AYL99_11193 [Fonsecaea erecta]
MDIAYHTRFKSLEFWGRIESITKQHPMIAQYLKPGGEWLKALAWATRVVSPFAWKEGCKTVCECQDKVLPLLEPDPDISPRWSLDSSGDQCLVTVEPGYQHFSKNFEQLFVLKQIRSSDKAMDLVWDEVKATIDHFDHPNLVKWVQAWTRSGFIELLSLAPETTLPAYMSQDKPTDEFLLSDLWLQLCGIASAVLVLHLHHDSIMRGWYHRISPDNILIFTMDDGKAVWKIGTLESGPPSSDVLKSGNRKSGILSSFSLRSGTLKHNAPTPVPESSRAHADEESDDASQERHCRPPEIAEFKSSKGQGPASDVWSLGCTFLQVLTWAFLSNYKKRFGSPDTLRFWERDKGGVVVLTPWVEEALNDLQAVDDRRRPHVSAAARVTRSMLATDQTIRPTLQEVVNHLDEVCRRQSSNNPRRASLFPYLKPDRASEGG